MAARTCPKPSHPLAHRLQAHHVPALGRRRHQPGRDSALSGHCRRTRRRTTRLDRHRVLQGGRARGIGWLARTRSLWSVKHPTNAHLLCLVCLPILPALHAVPIVSNPSTHLPRKQPYHLAQQRVDGFDGGGAGVDGQDEALQALPHVDCCRCNVLYMAADGIEQELPCCSRGTQGQAGGVGNATVNIARRELCPAPSMHVLSKGQAHACALTTLDGHVVAALPCQTQLLREGAAIVRSRRCRGAPGADCCCSGCCCCRRQGTDGLQRGQPGHSESSSRECVLLRRTRWTVQRKQHLSRGGPRRGSGGHRVETSAGFRLPGPRRSARSPLRPSWRLCLREGHGRGVFASVGDCPCLGSPTAAGGLNVRFCLLTAATRVTRPPVGGCAAAAAAACCLAAPPRMLIAKLAECSLVDQRAID